MKKGTLLRLLVVIGLALAVTAIPLTAACAKPAPSPSPSPKPVASPRPATEIMLPAGRVGAADAGYPLAQAIAYFLNRDSQWLRASVVATPGMTGNLDLIRENPKKNIGWLEGPSFVMASQQQQLNFYKSGRWIGAPWPITLTIITYDKNLKSVKDLAGKRVFLGRKGASTAFEQSAVLKTEGVLDKVKLDYGAYGDAISALQSGQTDAAFMVIDHNLPATFGKGPSVQEAEAKGPIYYVSVDGPAWRKTIAPKAGELLPPYGSLPVRIYPGALSDKTQPGEIWALGYMTMWLADESLDEDVVYEFTRVLWERAGQFATWHTRGACLTKEFVPAYQFSEGLMHKGAVKFYKERGVKVSNLLDLLP